MSLRIKTIAGIACIEAVLLVILISTTLNYLRTTNYDALLKQASTTATLFSSTTKNAVISYDLASLQSFADEFLKIPDILYIRIKTPSGKIFASAGSEVYLEREFSVDDNPENIDDGVFDQHIAITEGGTEFAQIEFGVDIEPILNSLSEAKQLSTFIAAIEMSLVALFSFLLGTYLTRQLWGLQRGAQSISQGNLDVDIDVKGNDEIAQVSKAFNAMAINLRVASVHRQKYEKELIDLNQSLEERVERRTEQLNKKYVELEAANRELKQAKIQLLSSDRMASIGLLAAGVAHEINNPMSFIMSNLRMLQHYTDNYLTLLKEYEQLAYFEDPEGRTKQVQRIADLREEMDLTFQNEDIIDLLNDSVEGSVRVRDIVAGLKDFSRVDSKNSFVLHNVNDCIESALKVSTNEIKHHCQLKKELAALPETFCLPGQLNQVILNLLVNASQAIKEQGVISIRSMVEGESIIIEIEDNGEGIPEDKLATIFDPFYTTKPEGVGTGLGLAISYGIVAEHCGSIDVKSEIGKGTCFRVILPISSEAPSCDVEKE